MRLYNPCNHCRARLSIGGNMTPTQHKQWQKLSHMQRRFAIAFWEYHIKSLDLNNYQVIYRNNSELYELAALKPVKKKSLAQCAHRLLTRNNGQLNSFIYGYDGIRWRQDLTYQRINYWYEKTGYIHPFVSFFPHIRRKEPLPNNGKLPYTVE